MAQDPLQEFVDRYALPDDGVAALRQLVGVMVSRSMPSSALSSGTSSSPELSPRVNTYTFSSIFEVSGEAPMPSVATPVWRPPQPENNDEERAF